MRHIIQEFERIDSEAELRAFLQKNGFRTADSRSHVDHYVLGAFIGKIDGRHADITHRLFDQDAASSAGIERNQVVLKVEGSPSIEVRFRGNY